MARARTVKLEILTDQDLIQAELDTGLPVTLAYIGLQMACDANGVFIWHLSELRKVALPGRPHVDFAAVMQALQQIDYVRRFEAEGSPYGLVTRFLRDQKPHAGEAPQYPTPPIELVPQWWQDRLRTASDPARSQNRVSKTGSEIRPRARGSDPDLSDPDHGLDPPRAPRAGDAPAARGGIDLSVYDQASRRLLGRGLTLPERRVLQRFLEQGHHGPTLLELMELHAEKVASSLVGYCVSAYQNGGGHVPKKRAQPARTAPASNPFEAYDEPELSDEEAAALEENHRRLMAEIAADSIGGVA